VAPFALAEYERRLRRTRERMEAAGIDVLLVSDPANMHWLSGFDAHSFYVGQMLIVALDEDRPLWVGREMDAVAARMTTWMGEEHIVGYGDELVQASGRHAMRFMADVVRDRGWHARRIAVEMDAYFYTARDHAELVAGLGAEPADGALLVNWARAVKSPAELKLMRRAARIAERAMETALERIAPGVRGCDVAAEVYRAQISGTPEHGGHYTASTPFLPTGRRSAAPHLGWTDAPHRTGESTTVELNGCVERYHVPLSRTVSLGEPPDALRRVAEGVVAGLGAAIEAMRPGATSEEVEAAWRRAAGAHGIAKASRLGYGIGVAYPPTTNERTMSLRPGDRTVLEPGMTLHVIPGIWTPDWGVIISEGVLVGAHGPEPFCTLPRELVVKA
jgi:Xaa-Pro dipeptidase